MPEHRLDIEIRQITITPSTGAVEVYYHISVETEIFTGAIGGGKTMVSDEEAVADASNLSETIQSAILQELGLKTAPTTDSLEDLSDDDEDEL